MGRLVRYLAVLATVSLTACAAAPPAPPDALFADRLFGAPSMPVGVESLFDLTPAMRAYLDSPAFARHLRERGFEHGLLDALYSKSDLMLEYDASMTRTAAQTYAAREGNCLSLVIMTSAFAQALGMTVRYQSVQVDATWSRNGALYLMSSHVNIVLGHRAGSFHDSSAGREFVVDFLPSKEAGRFRTRELTQDDIAMMYMNNRAVETLAQNRLDDAYWWARTAVATQPANVIAYNTLGVIYQRHGNPALAESAYRAALSREPDNVIVMQNLGPMLAAMGRYAEAQDLARHVARLEPAAPFEDVDRGMAAFDSGDYRTARDAFEREVRRRPYDDDVHFRLAVTLLRLGDAPAARDQLALAVDTSTRVDDRRRYSAKLSHLKQMAAGGVSP